ncbi:MAG: ribonuclease D [Marinicella pacifica]
MTKILSNYAFVDDINVAQKLLTAVDSQEYYPMDTEFERSRTFYLHPALLQVHIDDTFYLVDIAIKELAELFLPAFDKLILHSGSEDLELWRQVTGKKPRAVFDTQVAAALAGYSLHTSYQNLVESEFDVSLTQGMSRSDWLQRPLTEAQKEYAVEDIYYLGELKQRLSEQLSQRGLILLFEVLMQQQLDNLDTDGHNEKMYQKLVKSQRLDKQQRARLWRLLLWRDQLAQQRNKPRNWILKPPEMIAVVQQVTGFEDLFDIGLYPKFVKYNGRALLAALHGQDAWQDTEPPQIIKLNSRQGQQLQAMKKAVKDKATKADIDPALIVNNAGLKTLAFQGETLEVLPTWQALIEAGF